MGQLVLQQGHVLPGCMGSAEVVAALIKSLSCHTAAVPSLELEAFGSDAVVEALTGRCNMLACFDVGWLTLLESARLDKRRGSLAAGGFEAEDECWCQACRYMHIIRQEEALRYRARKRGIMSLHQNGRLGSA